MATGFNADGSFNYDEYLKYIQAGQNQAAARDWANTLDWGAGKSFRLPTEFEIARGSIPDSAKGAENDFRPNAQNAALLQSLGYSGNPLAGDTWTDAARTWLSDNGYMLGVGHEPGTSAQGRAEYFGLLGPDGKFVQGQADPTVLQSDSWTDIIAPFALMAAPIASAIGASAAAGSGAAVPATGSLGGLGAAETVTALGPAWSPSALGLTSLAPSTAAAELAAIGSVGLPGAVGASSTGGLLAGGEGITALGSSWSPASLGLTETIAPAISSSELAALGTLPTSLPTASIGGSAGLSSADKAALYGDAGYGPGMTGAQTSAYDSVLGATGSKGLADVVANSSLGSSLIDGVKSVSDLVGGGSNLAGIIGAIAGAADSGGTQTSSRDPWAASQPFLKNILADAETQRANLAANPFTPQQTQAYQNAYGGLDQARAALPGLLSWGQNAMQRQSTVPSYQQLFGGGLLAQPTQQPAQPTMQAGGSGGLLGGAPEDRLKALMAQGRGLIG